MKKNKHRLQIQNLTLSAMFLAIGLILPFFTGQIPQIGSMLLPMHIPVLICGMVCGPVCGGIVGFILPLFRYLLFGMPPIFPTGLAMAFELSAYAVIVGKLYYNSKWKCLNNLYFSLITAMIGGRVVWGLVFAILCGISGQPFTFAIFLTSALLNAIPGIIVQLIFVPVSVKTILRSEVLAGKTEMVK